MLIEKDWCDENTSHELWQLGLVPDTYYDGPHVLLYEAQKFLREEKKIEIVILGGEYCGGPYFVDVYNDGGPIQIGHKSYTIYEDALLDGVKFVIEYLKNNTNEE